MHCTSNEGNAGKQGQQLPLQGLDLKGSFAKVHLRKNALTVTDIL